MPRAVVAALLWTPILALPASALAQNSVTLTPPGQVAVLGDPASVALEISFTDPALGGGIVVEFDSLLLAFASFSFDPSFPDDPALRLVCPSGNPSCAGFSGPGVLIAFGVDGLSTPPVQGTHTVGALQLDTVGIGTSALSIREDDSVAGPLVGTGDFEPPSLSGASATVVAQAAPALEAVGFLLLATSLALAIVWVVWQERIVVKTP